MIKIDNDTVEVNHFPDNTQHIVFTKDTSFIAKQDVHTIFWRYENDEELFTLLCCVNFIRRLNKNARINLRLPYVPNGRMDRIKASNENFSLKVFADFINSLDFNKVIVKNAHSNVSLALINNVEDEGINTDVLQILIDLGILKIQGSVYEEDDKVSKDYVVFFPDEGACKRYSEAFYIKELGLGVAFGIKYRDWKTGGITDYQINGDVNGKKVLIIDDICSAGGTFYFAGKKLREMGAKEIDLYVTHCENNIENGKLLGEESPIRRIYTTNTILDAEIAKKYNDKIKIIQ